MHKETLTNTEAVVLQLLTTRGPMYGLEMVKAEPRLKRGTVYVLLSRLERKGWVKAKLVEAKGGEQGPARRRYNINAKGSRALESWKNSSALGIFVKGLGVER